MYISRVDKLIIKSVAPFSKRVSFFFKSLFISSPNPFVSEMTLLRQLVISWICVTLVVGLCQGAAQNAWYPNGQLRPIRNANGGGSNCGTCPDGYQREQVNSNLGYCGRCVPIDKSCATGNVLVGNQCQACPCPGTGDRTFGTACKVDVDGQITCECSNEYTGRDCSQCAPGAVASNQYPYNCIRVNGTSSQNYQCPSGNICPPPSIPDLVNRPQIQPPRYNNGCPTGCPTNGGQSPCGPQIQPPRPNPWPQPNPYPNPSPCPVPLPGPGPILCPQQPIGCPGKTQCPINNGYPPQIQCPINNGNQQIQCPPCPAPPPIQCPVPIQCPPVQGPCPPCPTQECPPQPNCPSPCPAIPNFECNRCPDPCPPCSGEIKCPNPCSNPCQQCPDIPKCPDCNCDCPKIPPCPGVPPSNFTLVAPCICDPRGTITQYGADCMCRANVEGYKCDTCKPGYFGLSKDHPEGCLQCWGSGVSNYCTAAIFYRTSIRSSRDPDCAIELTDERNTIVYNRESNSKFSWDGNEARLSLSVSTRLFWSLPACFKGNRLTSYGAILRFSRMFTGSGSALGSDNDLIIVGTNGATIIWSSFQSQTSGDWKTIQVRLDESEHWASWKSGTSRLATRFDILEVLANIQLILIRATFTLNTATASIKDVSLGSVSKSATSEGLVLMIEQARCPVGYQGLSCESCAVGFYRDATDMSGSVFGACKFCPCGRNSLGCHISYGLVVCKCKPGFIGDRCHDRETITVTLDPFWIRDCENTEVDFRCSFTTNSKRSLRIRLGPETESQRPEESTSISNQFKLSKNLGRIRCEIVDSTNTVWASVYAATQLEPCEAIAIIPPKVINIILKEEFICVNVSDPVEFNAEVHSFGSRPMSVEWRKEGSLGRVLPGSRGNRYVIQGASISDSGTYIASVADGDALAVAKVVLIVRDYPNAPTYPMVGDDPTVYIQEGNFTSKSSAKSSGTKGKQSPTSLLNSMQKDQPPEGYPTISVEPTEVIAQEGEMVVLRCNASGEEPMKFYWKSGSNDYIPVHVRVSRGALIFKSVKKEDQGSYYCVAWNNLGQVTAKANIIISDKTQEKNIPVTPLRITVPITNVTSAPGQHAYFNCSTNNPNVKPRWSRKTGEVLPDSSEVKPNGTLILYRVSEIDAGIYICKAVGLNQSVQVEATLSIFPRTPMTSPTISLNPKSPVKARSGEKVKVECIAFGYPRPNVTWSRSVEGTEKKLVSSDANGTYEIAHVTKSDEGKYTCTAVSEAGSKSESLSLVVDDSIICKENEFRCKSGDQCVPKEDRCDNERDCNDGSDEHHCRKQRTRRAVA